MQEACQKQVNLKNLYLLQARNLISLNTGEEVALRTASALAVTRLGLPIGLGAGLLGTFIGVATLFLMLRETKPLARLAAAVDKIDLVSGPAVLPALRRNTLKVRAVTDAFNRLQTRMASMLRARMALVCDLSHDVRTFAAWLRLRVENIADATERQKAISDIEDVILMLDNALLSSKTGAGELTQELVEFSDLIDPRPISP